MPSRETNDLGKIVKSQKESMISPYLSQRERNRRSRMIDPNQWIQGQEEVVQRVEKIPTKAAKSNELHKSKSMGSLLHDVSQVGLLKVY